MTALAGGMVALLLSSGCGVVEPAAATVNDHDIDRDSFEKELRALRDNTELQKRARNAASESVVATGLVGTGKETINSRISTQWLTSAVYDLVFTQELERRDLTPTEADRRAGEREARSSLSDEVFDVFPKWFRERIIARNARVQALQAALAGYSQDDAGLQKYYDEHKGDFDQICVSHILLDSKADADAAEARLKGGDAFAALAKELSGDKGTSEQGGDLGCTSRGRLVPEFETAAFAATAGVPTDPVETQFGWHIILVTKKQTQAFSEARESVAAQIGRLGGEKLDEFIKKALPASDVSIDPRYGTFEAPDDDSGRPASVVAPPAADPPSKRPGAATTTTTSGEPAEPLN